MSNKLKLYRCIFLKENKDYIIGKDIFNSKIYNIKKSEETSEFKIGTDNSFYASEGKKWNTFQKKYIKSD